VAEIPEVPKDQSEAVTPVLLNTPPMPSTEMPRKQEPKPDKRVKDKHDRRKRPKGKRS
jgi:hypothetical protein